MTIMAKKEELRNNPVEKTEAYTRFVLKDYHYPKNCYNDLSFLKEEKTTRITLEEFFYLQNIVSVFSKNKAINDRILRNRCLLIKNEDFNEFCYSPLKKKKLNLNWWERLVSHFISIDTIIIKLAKEKKNQINDSFIKDLTIIFVHIYNLQQLLPPNSGQSGLFLKLKNKMFNFFVNICNCIKETQLNIYFDRIQKYCNNSFFMENNKLINQERFLLALNNYKQDLFRFYINATSLTSGIGVRYLKYNNLNKTIQLNPSFYPKNMTKNLEELLKKNEKTKVSFQDFCNLFNTENNPVLKKRVFCIQGSQDFGNFVINPLNVKFDYSLICLVGLHCVSLDLLIITIMENNLNFDDYIPFLSSYMLHWILIEELIIAESHQGSFFIKLKLKTLNFLTSKFNLKDSPSFEKFFSDITEYIIYGITKTPEKNLYIEKKLSRFCTTLIDFQKTENQKNNIYPND